MWRPHFWPQPASVRPSQLPPQSARLRVAFTFLAYLASCVHRCGPVGIPLLPPGHEPRDDSSLGNLWVTCSVCSQLGLA